jgi:D-beta-D-heptose 7-phosphate kinase/D-beta-D-heptose 1-phosphate adenosyltransferase
MAKLDIIKNFEQKRVLLIGDTILDIYSYGKEVCLSSDSQAPEIEESEISISFGGASLVASNILELGGHVTFFSVIGDDESAKYYESFRHPKLDKHLLVDKTRPTTVKKRFWVNGQKMFQANRVQNLPISAEFEEKIITEIQPLIGKIDLIAVLDAQHGLLSPGLIGRLKELSQKHQKPLYIDSQVSHRPSNHQLYRGADCLFFNQTEAKAVLASFDIEHLEESLKSLQGGLGLVNVVVKLGERGSAALFNGRFVKGSPYRVKTVDPCGAGDAFLAAFSLGDRKFPEESLDIANAWAALSTTILGTVPPKKQDMIKIYGESKKTEV